MSIASIVSDYPILGATAERLLSERYEVHRATWAECEHMTIPTPDLVLLDVTHVTGDRVLSLVSKLLPSVSVYITSLDRNEVDIYKISRHGLAHQGELPNLLAIRV